VPRLVQHHPSDDTIVIELVEPADMPAIVRIVWPGAPTITTPAKLNEVAAKAMKILAYASTPLRPNPGSTEMLTRWMADWQTD
jgi:hypothetical protein